jgi:hypothetical protein
MFKKAVFKFPRMNTEVPILVAAPYLNPLAITVFHSSADVDS